MATTDRAGHRPDVTDPPRRRLAPRWSTLAAAGIGALATALVVVVPSLHFAYRSPEAHVALEMAAGLVALLTAFLVLGRVRQTRSLGDIGLACALGILGIAALLLYVVPAVWEREPSRFSTWAPLACSLLGAAIFAAAAVAPARTLRHPRRTAVALLLASAAAMAVTATAVALASDALPAAIDPNLRPESSATPDLSGHPAVLTIQLVVAALYAVGAVGLTRRAERTGDELLRWFAAGAALSVFARVNYFLFPSRFSEWLYTGDFLRLAFYTVLAYGAAREIATSQRGRAVVARVEERRRMARDLHDGLAQELAFIATRTRAMLAKAPDEELEMLASAAERALDESRRAIAALTQPLDEPLDAAIAREAEGIAGRSGVRLRLELAERPAVSPASREALLRIVREAITNAVRHGGAQAVTVRLSEQGDLRLEVIDDGRGFDPAGARSAGSHGLIGMRERVEALGGALRITSAPGAGTSIQAVLPE